MKLLGIDYGQRKVGLAISQGFLSEPYKVIRYINVEDLCREIEKIIQKEEIDQVVVGVSEGQIAEESKKFAKLFKAKLFDETLSTKDAQLMSLQTGMSRKKRKNMEDAFAASVMLQNYLDSLSLSID